MATTEPLRTETIYRAAQERIKQYIVTHGLKPGGYLHVATDWQDYADQALEVLGAVRGLANTVEGFAPRPASRPLTKFERRGRNLGHGVWDLLFERVDRA